MSSAVFSQRVPAPPFANEAGTSPELLAALASIKGYRMTPEEHREQRLSFVWGQAHRSGLSKDEVRAIIDGGSGF